MNSDDRYWVIDMAQDKHGNWVGIPNENGWSTLDGYFRVIGTTDYLSDLEDVGVDRSDGYTSA